MDRPGVAGRRVAEGILGGHGEIERDPVGCGRRRGQRELARSGGGDSLVLRQRGEAGRLHVDSHAFRDLVFELEAPRTRAGWNRQAGRRHAVRVQDHRLSGTTRAGEHERLAAGPRRRRVAVGVDQLDRDRTGNRASRHALRRRRKAVGHRGRTGQLGRQSRGRVPAADGAGARIDRGAARRPVRLPLQGDGVGRTGIHREKCLERRGVG